MKTWLRLVLIVMTVGGGFAGATLTLGSVFESDRGWASSLLMLLFGGIYVFILASGLVFTVNPLRTKLLTLALALQVPCVSSSILVYELFCGCSLVVRFGALSEGRVGFSWYGNLGSSFTVYLAGSHPLNFGLNLVPAVLLYLLYRSMQTHDVGTAPDAAEQGPSY